MELNRKITLEQKQAITGDEISKLMSGGARSLYCFAKQAFDLFWKNPHGLTCQQVFDSYGNQGVEMADLLSKAKVVIDTIDPTLWKLEKLGTVNPVLEKEQPTGYVVVRLADVEKKESVDVN